MPLLRGVVAASFRPRATIRRIAAIHDHRVIPILLLAFLSMTLKDVSIAQWRPIAAAQQNVIPIVCGALLCVAGLGVAVFYLVAWIGRIVARLLDGVGSTTDTRLALGWGLSPTVLALAYRIPAVFVRPAAGLTRIPVGAHASFSLDTFPHGWGLLLVIVDWLFAAWTVVVTSCTLAGVHRFSALRGAATLAAAIVAPTVIIVAAAIAASAS